MPAEFTSTSFTPDNLLAGGEILSRAITLVSGQNLLRGAVLGKITASGKYNLSLAAANDGSETPDLILAEDTDASGGDKQTVAYFLGNFVESRLTIGTGHTANSIREGLRVKGIQILPGVQI